MPRINLLPWREEERKKRQKDFMVALGGAVVAAGAVFVLTLLAFNQMIDSQVSRNQRLETEIAELEKSITEIDNLERQKERLLARMEIIEQLQRSRPEIVHLFDEMSRVMPEGVYLNGMRQTGSVVELKGVAQSSTRVSALMRQADESAWLTDPEAGGDE
jgi:type IV pilus assembly protein PilN